MKITHVTTRVLRTPADNPLVVGLPAPTDTREFVTLELGTDQGLVGVGLTFFGGALTRLPSPRRWSKRVLFEGIPKYGSEGDRRSQGQCAIVFLGRCP